MYFTCSYVQIKHNYGNLPVLTKPVVTVRIWWEFRERSVGSSFPDTVCAWRPNKYNKSEIRKSNFIIYFTSYKMKHCVKLIIVQASQNIPHIDLQLFSPVIAWVCLWQSFLDTRDYERQNNIFHIIF